MLSVDEALISYAPLKNSNTASERPPPSEAKRVQMTFTEIMAILSSTKDGMVNVNWLKTYLKIY